MLRQKILKLRLKNPTGYYIYCTKKIQLNILKEVNFVCVRNTSGRFLVGTNQPYRKGAVPSKIKDILIGCLLGDASGELGPKAKTPCFAF